NGGVACGRATASHPKCRAEHALLADLRGFEIGYVREQDVIAALLPRLIEERLLARCGGSIERNRVDALIDDVLDELLPERRRGRCAAHFCIDRDYAHADAAAVRGLRDRSAARVRCGSAAAAGAHAHILAVLILPAATGEWIRWIIRAARSAGTRLRWRRCRRRRRNSIVVRRLSIAAGYLGISRRNIEQRGIEF